MKDYEELARLAAAELALHKGIEVGRMTPAGVAFLIEASRCHRKMVQEARRASREEAKEEPVEEEPAPRRPHDWVDVLYAPPEPVKRDATATDAEGTDGDDALEEALDRAFKPYEAA